MARKVEKKIVYKHPTYGEIVITEPVVVELISQPYFERLKGIDQGGFKPLLVKSEVDISNFIHSRYAHSLGVYNLLKKYGAPMEEQLAGLLHDVSHFAFSHCADYAIAEGSEKEHTLQDDNHDFYIENKTNIAEILKKYGFDLHYILDDKNFPLKENNIPDICADRIDYMLQTAAVFGETDQQKLKYVFVHLKAENGKWFFDDFESAKFFAELFWTIDENYYSGLKSGAMFAIVGDYLKYAIEKKYISKDELWTDDQTVIAKISKHLSADSKLQQLWDLMNLRIGFTENNTSCDREVFCKVRRVDPFFLENGICRRVSEADEDFKDKLTKAGKSNQYFIKYLFDK